MIAFVFALPEESRGLARAVEHPVRTGEPRKPDIRGKLAGREVVVIHTGMGLERARERMSRLWCKYPEIQCVIGAGYAGGLDPGLPSGGVVLGENYSTPEMLGWAVCVLEGRCRAGVISTSPVVLETCAEKAAHARATGAIAAEMETSAVVEACRAQGVPFLAVRVISDTACEELAVPFSVCFDAVLERPRTIALLGFLARNPKRVPAFARFVRDIGRAQRVLTGTLIALASDPGIARCFAIPSNAKSPPIHPIPL